MSTDYFTYSHDSVPVLVVVDSSNEVVFRVYETSSQKISNLPSSELVQASFGSLPGEISSSLTASGAVDSDALALNAIFTGISVLCVLVSLLLGVMLTRMITNRMNRR